MKFALLYVYDPTTTSPTEGEIADWLALDEKLKSEGTSIGGEGFHSRDEAQVVRVRDGASRIETEPTAPAAHTVAGFYIVDAPSIEAATEIAHREVRLRRGPPHRGLRGLDRLTRARPTLPQPAPPATRRQGGPSACRLRHPSSVVSGGSAGWARR
ncbi:YciI family protein [Pseudonocardia nigra]|uniref:YciI family protein n=1 Tax=Pseudonocardia nigra TaxID=1921578 RepID=UPI001C5E3213|nr:YciI family protein [Pseudonocardia nigra]